MLLKSKSFSTLLFALPLACLLLLPTLEVKAQATAPDLMITWEAKSYTPPTYFGRALPTLNTPINLSLNLLDNGKIVDLSKNKIVWLTNGTKVSADFGKTRFSFIASRSESQKIDVTVENYKNKNITKLVIIPSVEPEVVIDAPTNNQSLPNGLIRIGALPYFFNTQTLKNLTVSWQVSDFKIERSADLAQYVDIDTKNSKNIISISAKIINPNALIESSTKKINFIVE